MQLSYDLHIHSCLSPCASDDMTPYNIAGMAKIKGLDLIAVTDHNSCKNCPSVLHHAKQLGIIAIPGMEITTAEEVHVLCLFPTLEFAMRFDEYVHAKLLNIPNDECIFGKQQILDFEDVVVENESISLVGATQISFYDLYDLIKSYAGVMIPAHIDKQTNSLISNLGFIPPDSQFTSVEIKNDAEIIVLSQSNPYITKCKIFHNSDAHYLQDINEPTEKIEVEKTDIISIFKALQNY